MLFKAKKLLVMTFKAKPLVATNPSSFLVTNLAMMHLSIIQHLVVLTSDLAINLALVTYVMPLHQVFAINADSVKKFA